jgi:DnaJ-class molecular chaperone
MPTCYDCEGTQYVLNTYNCPKCDGTGEIVISDLQGREKVITCSFCDNGHIYKEEPCDTCQGTGVI